MDNSFESPDLDIQFEGFLVLNDGKILVYGNGIPAMKRLNSNGSLDTSYNYTAPSDKIITGLKPQSDGKLVVLTNFEIFRINSSGQKDESFNDAAANDFKILTFEIQNDDKILVGGEFKAFNNQIIKGFLRLNADGIMDDTFNQNLNFGQSPPPIIRSIVAQNDGKIILSGYFNGYDGMNYKDIVRLNNDGLRDESFQIPVTTNYGGLSKVSLLSNGEILAAVTYTEPNLIDEIIKISPLGERIYSFSFTDFKFLSLFVTPTDEIIVGGNFPQNKILKKIDAQGNEINTFSFYIPQNGFIGEVKSITNQPDGKFLVGGKNFKMYNGEDISNLIRIDSNGDIDPTFYSVIPYVVEENSLRYAELLDDGRIVLSYVSGIGTTTITRLNSNGSSDPTFTSLFHYTDLRVSMTKTQTDGKIIAVGDLFSNGIIRLNYDGTLDTTFELDPYFNDFTSRSIYAAETLNDGKILIGGFIYQSNNNNPLRVYRLNSDGSLDNSFNSAAFNNTITRLKLLPDGKILVGGSFGGTNAVGTFPFNKIARLNADGSLDESFDTNNPDWKLYTLNDFTIQDEEEKVVIAGVFQLNDGTKVNGVVRVDYNDGSVDPNFESSFFTEFSGKTVNAVAAQDDNKIVLGGNFRTYGGTHKNNIIRVYGEGQTYVPDSLFEQALIELGLDNQQDEYVLTRNITPVNTLDVSNREISDLTGIQDFASINYLDASHNNISNLNLTGRDETEEYYFYNNKQLEYLDVSHNELEKLKVSQLPALKTLFANNNRLTKLDVKNGNNTNFTAFNSLNNQDLVCIQVDNAQWSINNWTDVDDWSSFDEDCEYLSIAENKIDELMLFPNPTNDVIHFSKTVRDIKVFDLSGKLIMKIDKPTNQINLIDLRPGVYIINSTFGNNKQLKRKVIKH